MWKLGLVVLIVLGQCGDNAWADIPESPTTQVPVPMSFYGIVGQTAVYSSHLTNLPTGVLDSARFTDLNMAGGSDGLFSGFDLDFVLLDVDGVFNSGDEFPVVTGASLTPGSVRRPTTTPFRSTAAHPGPLFGLDAAGKVVPNVVTLSKHDASYVPGPTLGVDTSHGWLSLGDGGVLDLRMAWISSGVYPDLHIYVGDAGSNDEAMDAQLQLQWVRVAPFPEAREPIDLSNLNWSVQYMIDRSQNVQGQSQLGGPTDNRGLAIDPSGQYLYAGYNNPRGDYRVRKIDVTQSDYTMAAVASVTGHRGKAISVDDQGRVYLAEGGSGGVYIYDANLTSQQFHLQASSCEGVAVTRENGKLVLYSTARNDGTLTRWELTEGAGTIIAAVKAGLDGDGVIHVDGADDLRGLALDSSGRIWMADAGGGKVFRVDNDGTHLTSTDVANPYAIAFNGDQALVTGGYSGVISVLNPDLSSDGTITPPLGDLELEPDVSYADGNSFGGIVVTGDGLYLTNEGGRTYGDRSAYGPDDAESGWYDGHWYADLTHADGDPILYATPGALLLSSPPVAEPATMLLVALGAIALVKRRQDRARNSGPWRRIVGEGAPLPG